VNCHALIPVTSENLAKAGGRFVTTMLTNRQGIMGRELAGFSNPATAKFKTSH
jgi:hypothetical protein